MLCKTVGVFKPNPLDVKWTQRERERKNDKKNNSLSLQHFHITLRQCMKLQFRKGLFDITYNLLVFAASVSRQDKDNKRNFFPNLSILLAHTISLTLSLNTHTLSHTHTRTLTHTLYISLSHYLEIILICLGSRGSLLFHSLKALHKPFFLFAVPSKFVFHV